MRKIEEFCKEHKEEIIVVGGGIATVALVVGSSILLKKAFTPKVYSKSIPWTMYGKDKTVVDNGLKLAQNWLNEAGKYITSDMAFNVFPNNPAEIESCMDIFKSLSDSDSFAVCIMGLNR